MPLNKAVFKVRALSAVVFVVVMLAGLLYNHWSFLVLFCVIHAGCWWEYMRLVSQIDRLRLHSWMGYGYILSGMGLMMAFCGNMWQVGGYVLGGSTVLPFLLSGFLLMAAGLLHPYTRIHHKGFARLAAGWLYISVAWGIMLYLRRYGAQGPLGDGGWLVPLLLIGSIWINDTMAYIVGSLIGKTPLSRVSPKKTWEGTLGGIVLAIGVVALLARWVWGISWQHAVCMPALAATAGTAGDLLESKLKRMAGVKDSGQMLPGHGGFLDRFDSLLLATPVVGLYLLLAG